MTAKKRTSGPTQSAAARRAKGLTRVEFWLSPRAVEVLDAFAEELGSRVAAIESVLDGAGGVLPRRRRG